MELIYCKKCDDLVLSERDSLCPNCLAKEPMGTENEKLVKEILKEEYNAEVQNWKDGKILISPYNNASAGELAQKMCNEEIEFSFEGGCLTLSREAMGELGQHLISLWGE